MGSEGELAVLPGQWMVGNRFDELGKRLNLRLLHETEVSLRIWPDPPEFGVKLRASTQHTSVS